MRRLTAIFSIIFFSLFTLLGKDSGDVKTCVQKQLEQQQHSFYRLKEDAELINALYSNHLNKNQQHRLFDLNYELLAFEKDSLLFYNQNRLMPDVELLRSGSPPELMRFHNGFYVVDSLRIGQQRSLWALFPVKYSYGIQNRYLHDELVCSGSENVDILTSSSDSGETVFLNEKALFKVLPGTNADTGRKQTLVLFAFLGFCLVYGLLLFAAVRSAKSYPFASTLGLLLTFVLLRYLQLRFFPLLNLNWGEFTSPDLFASSMVHPSLADLFLNTVLIFSLVSFLRWNFNKGRGVSSISNLLQYVVLFISAISFIFPLLVSRSLIDNSVLSLNVTRFEELSVYSLLAILIIGIQFLSYFNLSSLLLILSKRTNEWSGLIAKLSMIHLCVAFPIYYIVPLPFGLLALVLFISVIYHFVRMRDAVAIDGGINFGRSLMYLLLFTTALSFFINYYQGERDKRKNQQVAVKLIDERDYLAEFSFKELAPLIAKDPFVQLYFSDANISSRNLNQRINLLYLSGYFTAYELNLIAFDTQGFAVRSDMQKSFKDYLLKWEKADSTASDNLRFMRSERGDYYYLAIIPVGADSQYLGNLVMELKPKTFNQALVYPELLLDKKIEDAGHDKVYHALYIQGKLHHQSGNFPYSYNLIINHFIPENSFKEYSENGFTHLVYHAADSRHIIISQKSASPFTIFSLFSYIYLFYLSFIILIYLFNYWIQHRFPSPQTLFSNLSFRYKLNISMLFLILISFLAIGMVTVYYFKNFNDKNQAEELLKKQKAVLSALETQILDKGESAYTETGNRSIAEDLAMDVSVLSEVYAMDINLYDNNGDLILSSQPVIFERGLISEKMNAHAFYEMSRSRISSFLHEEEIGSLKFLSSYAPVHNSAGRVIAYLNLPFFSQSESLKHNISAFLEAVVNIYVVLLLLTLWISFSLSRSMTVALSRIGEYLRKISVQQKNEFIPWAADDEIGRLVKEYNRMIDELEKSAKALAKNEREGAWKEMARQVAHEIKNPLTPMKLSVQHLQRAIANDTSENAKLTQRVSKTLIEQIDHLSQIAIAFSSFADLPKGNLELVNLVEVLKNIYGLFVNSPNVKLSLSMETDVAEVMADRSRLVSVFTNLLKNAIQSIPEEQAGEVTLQLKTDADCYYVSVLDNGIGIPESVREKLFIPNFTTKSSGTGLGLAISKRIVESMAGSINFESVEGKGSTFVVRLPKHV